ncbi:hypothetical protein DAERI_060055 [Deinococcus aerius]|uniref:Uncharacterized protein n=1 Tax=Deinococcus aerius TaxID=200253 RepID=A0A2I9DY78_9DEIO|nr:hypothetical protein [Deinococcus aerius]GBF05795.1 hypothetical protein DAERI_060055 [Deinococcus aerius]
MKEKVKRLLDLVRAGRLSLEDAGPLLAALSPRLALTDSDRELIASLLAREDLDTGQVADHLLLLRGVRDTPPSPPFPPRAPRAPGWPGVDGWVDRFTDNIEGFVDRMEDTVERAVEGRGPRSRYSYAYPGPGRTSRLLRIQVESNEGDEYTANLPVSLAPHLGKLIPPHGREALERAGLSIEALQLLIEADPPPGDLIETEDNEGNSVKISLK